MEDTLTSKETETSLSPNHHDQPNPSSKWKVALSNTNTLCILVGGFALFWLVSPWVGARGGPWTCEVGTSKYDSFDAWGGRMGIQKDGGNCTSRWKCAVDFSFSRGSVFLTRGCLNEEKAKALKEDTVGPLWLIQTNFWDRIGLDCFVMKKDESTLSCAYNQVPMEEVGMRIPSRFTDEFRKTLCNSTQIKPPWWTWLLPFVSSDLGLSCPSTEELSKAIVKPPFPSLGSIFGIKNTTEQEWDNFEMGINDFAESVENYTRAIVNAVCATGWGWNLQYADGFRIGSNACGSRVTPQSKNKDWEVRVQLPTGQVFQSTHTVVGRTIRVTIGKRHWASITVPAWVRGVEDVRVEMEGSELVVRPKRSFFAGVKSGFQW